jgi:uncharacterized damage-inducible protein DinB
VDPRSLLLDTYAHIPPRHALERLAAADAERHPHGAPHSVAEIVAHLCFWQEWFCARCDGDGRPMPAHAAEGWPKVAAGTWPEVQARFLAGLDRAAALGDRADHPVAPAIDFPPMAHYSVHDALLHIAQHNAHHLGQVVLLRQMMGQWPPPAGSWTW